MIKIQLTSINVLIHKLHFSFLYSNMELLDVQVLVKIPIIIIDKCSLHNFIKLYCILIEYVK